ncbi:MAG: hypothetical protein ABI304_04880, partial [Rudaea sp.]
GFINKTLSRMAGGFAFLGIPARDLLARCALCAPVLRSGATQARSLPGASSLCFAFGTGQKAKSLDSR